MSVVEDIVGLDHETKWDLLEAHGRVIQPQSMDLDLKSTHQDAIWETGQNIIKQVLGKDNSSQRLNAELYGFLRVVEQLPDREVIKVKLLTLISERLSQKSEF